MPCNCTLTGDSLTLLRRPHVNGALQPWKKRTRRSYMTCRGNIRGRFPNWWRSERGCWLRRRPPQSLVICENVCQIYKCFKNSRLTQRNRGTTCIEPAEKNDSDADLFWQTWCSAGHLPYLASYLFSQCYSQRAEWVSCSRHCFQLYACSSSIMFFAAPDF